MPENDVWQLYRAAYEQYQLEILNGEKAYSRYVNDFVSYHLPCTSMYEAEIRLHIMRVLAIKELLEERRDLVLAFFTKETFEEKEYLQMYYLFNTGKNIVPDKVFLAHFSDWQIYLITQFVNETSLFNRVVTEEDIRNLFECQLTVPLQATVNRHVALFFGKLRDQGLIPHSWQLIMENHKLVSSSATNEPMRASQLRCGLSQARCANLGKKPNSDIIDEEIGFYETCDTFVKKLKESL